ncbi:MAG: 7-carboxy-7-deazaguanine synthase [Sphingobium sp. 32-64-5]|nr:MAG: 7-carboxy-7-deazaguanine synthase [Sphingobium sp. 32-64-5]
MRPVRQLPPARQGLYRGGVVFLRFAGCNLWTGREQDRARAICRFCDTDFVGTDGENGARYPSAAALADMAARLWGTGREERYIVLTGGEPMLQVDDALIDALHQVGFEIAIESNGTLPVHPGIDWVCISPKAGSEVVQRSGDELKLVWPQPAHFLPGHEFADMAHWDFTHFLLQPLDDPDADRHREECIARILAHPRWRLTLQTHKMLGLK